MYSGFGRGRGASSSARGGMGFGFRGSSPPPPYTGRGRGGLPRCGYYAAVPGAVGSVPGAAPLAREEELNFLKAQAQALKDNMERINTRLNDLESKK